MIAMTCSRVLLADEIRYCLDVEMCVYLISKENLDLDHSSFAVFRKESWKDKK